LNPFQIFFLSVVHGLTDILPVSSEGHLILLRNLFHIGLAQASVQDVFLRAGTILSMAVFFRGDLKSLASSLVSKVPSPERGDERRKLLFIVVSTAVTVFIGWRLQGPVLEVESFFPAVGVGFLMTALFLTAGIVGATSRDTFTFSEMSWLHPVLLGTVQGMAVWPGLSRSGATIGLALFLGWTWSDAGRFSFLMAIPAATITTILSARALSVPPHPGWLIVGSVVSFFIGLAALALLMGFLQRRVLWPFAAYAILLAFCAFVK